MPSDWTIRRARVAALSREHDDDSEVMRIARRELRAAFLEERVNRALAAQPELTPEERAHIAKVLMEAPPLTTEQRQQIALLMNAPRPPANAVRGDTA